MRKDLKNRIRTIRDKALNKWRNLIVSFPSYKNKGVEFVKNRIKTKESFIKVPVSKKLIIWISIIVVGISAALYSQGFGKEISNFLADKPIFANVSNLIYKVSWEEKFKIEELEREVEMSGLEERRAKGEAQESKIAKEEAEQKTQQETEKRSRAEAAKKVAQQRAVEEEDKRIQEELARQVAEQEVLAKEAEEEKMNADSDGDGLTYRQELDQGTLDTNKDSDDDGINDNEDANPSGGGRYLAQNFQWEHNGKSWTRNYSIQEDWYEYYKNKPRSSHGLEYVIENDPFIKEIAEALKEIADRENYHRSSFIVSFVQGLPYVADFYTNVADLPKYPIETFVERNGDCEDTSYLFASLVQAMGLGASLIEFHDHMGVGIKTVHAQSGYYYPIGNDWYYYYETTEKGWKIGQLPEDYLHEKAKITRIWDGNVSYSGPQYVKPCYSSLTYSGYYSDGENIYSDSQCNYLANCIFYEDFYINPQTQSFYHNSGCTQIAVPGCYKSTNYPGYFYDDSDLYYYDSRCTQTAKICEPSLIYSDRYWDGDYSYWDSSCTQKVVSWCAKSTYKPGYFISSIDYKYYHDYQCTQEATP